MIVQPKIRGFICTTAHPAGCAKRVQNEIDCVTQNTSSKPNSAYLQTQMKLVFLQPVLEMK